MPVARKKKEVVLMSDLMRYVDTKVDSSCSSEIGALINLASKGHTHNPWVVGR